jgi:hypothetical protein
LDVRCRGGVRVLAAIAFAAFLAQDGLVEHCAVVTAVHDEPKTEWGEIRVLALEPKDGVGSIVLRGEAFRSSPLPARLDGGQVCVVGASYRERPDSERVSVVVSDAGHLTLVHPRQYTTAEMLDILAALRAGERLLAFEGDRVPEQYRDGFFRIIDLSLAERQAKLDRARAAADRAADRESHRAMVDAIVSAANQVAAALNTGTATYTMPPPARPRRRGRVESVDGELVTLEDGTAWRVDGRDLHRLGPGESIDVVASSAREVVIVDRSGHQLRARRVR